ncbi:MAG: S-layer homology domain-containing protein, partial [Oscillospiraceae bacterium]|nr:S-layer homology domain-containing protein [Oscillospiraceae bacterium]
DVPADAWYAKAVEWAAANEIVKGIGSNKFAPDAPISREQIATILFRYDGGVKVEGSLEAYPDADKVGSYATDGMLWAIENEIITGVAVGEATYLNPQENATREQIATIMMRYLEAE